MDWAAVIMAGDWSGILLQKFSIPSLVGRVCLLGNGRKVLLGACT